MTRSAYPFATRALTWIAVAYAATQLFSVLSGGRQNDFKTYYYAAKADEQGLDPYDLQILRQVSGISTLKQPFVYPPHTLGVFKGFARLGFTPAYYLFLALKLACLAGLAWIWMRVVPAGPEDRWALLVTFLLGYRSAVLRDMNAGNVATFEQLLLWGGVLLLLHAKLAAGGLGILLSAFFKLVTGLLAPLVVIVHRSWRSFGILVALGVGWTAALFASYAASPEQWVRFLSASGSLDERGNRCPSSWAFFHDCTEAAGLGRTAPLVLYAAFCLVVVSLFLWAFFLTRRPGRDVFPLLHLALLSYVLVAPRMKDYSFIIALLPTLHALSAACPRRWLAVAGCVLLWVPLFAYQSLALALLVFGLLAAWIWRHRQEPERMALTLDPLRGFRAALR